MSYLRFDRDTPHRQKQRGAAFIVMLVVLVLGIATVLVTSLSTAGLKIERDVKTAEALAQAKEALIGKSAIYNDYPGSLPCPDTDDDGESNSLAPNDCPQYIGRLPWKTLQLPDLRDAAGERLWYVLSRNVRRYDSVRPLNSDVTGTLNITGTSPENNLMAIVFAPGSAIGGQRRSSTQSALCVTTNTSIPENRCAANYLEGSNDDLDPNLNFQNANSVTEFNDQLISISHDQLFTTTEKRVGNEIKNVLKKYYDDWGAFPYPALFAYPPTATFTGQSSTYEGLLPIGNLLPASTSLAWDTTPAPRYYINGVYSGDCYFSNGAVNYSRLRCISSNITIPAGATVTFTGTLFGVGFGLWKKHDIDSTAEFRVKDSTGTTVLASTKFTNPSIVSTLNTDGSATITFSGTMKAGTSTQRTIQRIEFRDIQRYVAPTIPTWLFSETNDESPNCDASFDSCNDWHKLAYYAVAEEYAPGGDHTCTPTPCLTVNGQNGGSDVPAVILMSGRTIAGAHPSAALNDYLEGTNRTPGDLTFENQPLTSTFNDQVIIIAP